MMYRSKFDHEIVVEAVQYDGFNLQEVERLIAVRRNPETQQVTLKDRPWQFLDIGLWYGKNEDGQPIVATDHVFRRIYEPLEIVPKEMTEGLTGLLTKQDWTTIESSDDLQARWRASERKLDAIQSLIQKAMKTYGDEKRYEIAAVYEDLNRSITVIRNT